MAFLQLLFDLRRLAVLLGENGFRDAVPEAATFVGELLGFRRDDLWDGPERIEVDKQLRLLRDGQSIDSRKLWDVTIPWGSEGNYLCVFHCVPYLILPAAVDPCKNILFRDILDFSHGVVVRVILKYNSEDPVLCLP